MLWPDKMARRARRSLSERGLFGYGEFRHPFQDAPRLAAGRLHFFATTDERFKSKTKIMK
jgi:hypothetical protein